MLPNLPRTKRRAGRMVQADAQRLRGRSPVVHHRGYPHDKSRNLLHADRCSAGHYDHQPISASNILRVILTSNMMTLPKPIPQFVVALGIAVLVSGAFATWLALQSTPVAWFFLGFELVTLLAAVFLIGLGLGKVTQGPALTLLCAAGAIGMGTYLGWLASGRELGGQRVSWLIASRGLCAAALVLFAALDVITRAPKQTVPRIIWGMAGFVLFAAAAGLYKLGVIPSLMNKIGNINPAVEIGAWLIFLLIIGGFICLAAHGFIRAFEIGVHAGEETSHPPKASAGPQTTAVPQIKPVAKPAATSVQSPAKPGSEKLG
jgi:hypothetical protein